MPAQLYDTTPARKTAHLLISCDRPVKPSQAISLGDTWCFCVTGSLSPRMRSASGEVRREGWCWTNCAMWRDHRRREERDRGGDLPDHLFPITDPPSPEPRWRLPHSSCNRHNHPPWGLPSSHELLSSNLLNSGFMPHVTDCLAGSKAAFNVEFCPHRPR